MLQKRIMALLFVPLLLLGAASEDVKVTVDDVIKLHKEGLGVEVIVSFIETSGQVFEITTDDLVKLKKAGVHEDVIKAMINTRKKNPDKNNDSSPNDNDKGNESSVKDTPNGKVVTVPTTGGNLTDRITGKSGKTGEKTIIEPEIEYIKKYDSVFLFTVYKKKLIVPDKLVQVGHYDPLSNKAERNGTLFLTRESIKMFDDNGELKYEIPFRKITDIKIIERYPDRIEARYHPLDSYELRIEFDRKGKSHFAVVYALPYVKEDGETANDRAILLAEDVYELGIVENSKLNKPKRVH